MKITVKIKYKKSLLIDEQLLQGVNSILLRFYKTIYYKATLINDFEVKFDSLDELLQYHNYGDMKIKKLSIDNWGDDLNYSLYFEEGLSFLHKFGSSANGYYEVNNESDSILIGREIMSLFERKKQNATYNFMAKFSIMYIWALLLLIIAMIEIYQLLSGVYSQGQGLNYNWGLGAVLTAILIAICTAIDKLRKKFFPGLVFYWGDEKAIYDKRESKRTNFFYSVIIATVIAFVAPFIQSLF